MVKKEVFTNTSIEPVQSAFLNVKVRSILLCKSKPYNFGYMLAARAQVLQVMLVRNRLQMDFEEVNKMIKEFGTNRIYNKPIREFL
jgi:hypothetical protein